MIEGLALRKPRLSVATIHRQTVEAAAKIGEPSPSYDVVYAVIGELEPALLTMAHDGSKSYGDRFELVHRREAEAPNAIWQADGVFDPGAKCIKLVFETVASHGRGSHALHGVNLLNNSRPTIEAPGVRWRIDASPTAAKGRGVSNTPGGLINTTARGVLPLVKYLVLSSKQVASTASLGGEEVSNWPRASIDSSIVICESEY